MTNYPRPKPTDIAEDNEGEKRIAKQVKITKAKRKAIIEKSLRSKGLMPIK